MNNEIIFLPLTSIRSGAVITMLGMFISIIAYIWLTKVLISSRKDVLQGIDEGVAGLMERIFGVNNLPTGATAPGPLAKAADAGKAFIGGAAGGAAMMKMADAFRDGDDDSDDDSTEGSIKELGAGSGDVPEEDSEENDADGTGSGGDGDSDSDDGSSGSSMERDEDDDGSKSDVEDKELRVKSLDQRQKEQARKLDSIDSLKESVSDKDKEAKEISKDLHGTGPDSTDKKNPNAKGINRAKDIGKTSEEKDVFAHVDDEEYGVGRGDMEASVGGEAANTAANMRAKPLTTENMNKHSGKKTEIKRASVDKDGNVYTKDSEGNEHKVDGNGTFIDENGDVIEVRRGKVVARQASQTPVSEAANVVDTRKNRLRSGVEDKNGVVRNDKGVALKNANVVTPDGRLLRTDDKGKVVAATDIESTHVETSTGPQKKMALTPRDLRQGAKDKNGVIKDKDGNVIRNSFVQTDTGEIVATDKTGKAISTVATGGVVAAALTKEERQRASLPGASRVIPESAKVGKIDPNTGRVFDNAGGSISSGIVDIGGGNVVEVKDGKAVAVVNNQPGSKGSLDTSGNSMERIASARTDAKTNNVAQKGFVDQTTGVVYGSDAKPMTEGVIETKDGAMKVQGGRVVGPATALDIAAHASGVRTTSGGNLQSTNVVGVDGTQIAMNPKDIVKASSLSAISGGVNTDRDGRLTALSDVSKRERLGSQLNTPSLGGVMTDTQGKRVDQGVIESPDANYTVESGRVISVQKRDENGILGSKQEVTGYTNRRGLIVDKDNKPASGRVRLSDGSEVQVSKGVVSNASMGAYMGAMNKVNKGDATFGVMKSDGRAYDFNNNLISNGPVILPNGDVAMAKAGKVSNVATKEQMARAQARPSSAEKILSDENTRYTSSGSGSTERKTSRVRNTAADILETVGASKMASAGVGGSIMAANRYREQAKQERDPNKREQLLNKARSLEMSSFMSGDGNRNTAGALGTMMGASRANRGAKREGSNVTNSIRDNLVSDSSQERTPREGRQGSLFETKTTNRIENVTKRERVEREERVMRSFDEEGTSARPTRRPRGSITEDVLESGSAVTRDRGLLDIFEESRDESRNALRRNAGRAGAQDRSQKRTLRKNS